jgi:AraC-like DNA-binding protein
MAISKDQGSVSGGEAFFVKSTLNSIYQTHRMEFKQKEGASASVTYAHLPYSLISHLVISSASHMSLRKAEAYYLIVVQSGTIQYSIDNNNFTARAGDCVVLDYGQSLDRRTADDGMDIYVFKLDKDRFHRVMSTYMEDGFSVPKGFHKHLTADNPKAQNIRRLVTYTFEEVVAMSEQVAEDEGEGSDFYQRVMLNNLEEYFMRALLMSLRKKMPLAESLAKDGMDGLPQYLVDAIKYINSNITDPLQISDFSAIIGVSQRSLSNAFQSHMGVSPKQYIKAVRLDGVRDELLKLGCEAVVTDVATKWGFSQLGSFSADYKKRFGELPSETVRQARQELD